MALPKTFSSGERLFASDLNSNFEDLDGRDLEDLANVSGTPTDGQILAFGTATSTWNPTDQLAGIGSNVVSYTKGDTFTVSGAGDSTWRVIGNGTNNLEVTITPTSATSRVLIIAHVAVVQEQGANASEFLNLSLFRDSTNLSTATSPSNRVPGFHGENQGQRIGGDRSSGSFEMHVLDSPATTSAITYSAQYMRQTSGTTYINRSSGDGDFTYVGRYVSVITAIEVAS